MACVRLYRGNWIVDWRDEKKKRHLDQVAGEAEGHRRLAELKDNEMKAPNKNSFKEYGEWWLENCAKGEIKDSTYEEYERVLKLHLYPDFGSKQFSKITRKMVRELIAAKKKEGLSQSSIRNILAPMRGMYNHAIEDDDVQRNPASRMGKFNKKNAGTCSNCRHAEDFHSPAGCNRCGCAVFVPSDKKNKSTDSRRDSDHAG